MKERKISIFPLLAVSFIGTLGFGIVLPSLVYLVRTFRGGPFIYGALGATYSAFQLIGSPMLGKLSDRFGRKKILFLSVLGSAVAWALFLFALSMPITLIGEFSTGVTGAVAITVPMLCLFIARSVDGLTAGDVSVANAYVADITTHDERKADFGKMGVAANLGFMLGPVFAGVLADTSMGLALPIGIALATSILGLLLVIFFLPESHPKPISKPIETTAINQSIGRGHKECYEVETPAKMTLAKALRLDGVPLLLSIYFVFFLAFSLFVASLPLFATEVLAWSVTQLGLFFSFLSIVMVITEGPVLSRLSKRFSAETLTIWGCFIVSFGYLSLLTSNQYAAYLGAALYAVGNGLMWPSFLSLLSDRAGDENQGYIQGIGTSVGSLASIAGLLAGGILYTNLHGGVFLLTAALVAAVGFLSFRLRGAAAQPVVSNLQA